MADDSLNEYLDELAGKLLRNDSSISVLSLQEKNLRDEDVDMILRSLTKNSTVTDIDLRFNRLGTGAATSLAKLLSQNKTVVKLRLHGNSLGAAGAEILSPAIGGLKILDIGGNKINGDGISKLMEAIKKSSKLTMLDVAENVLGHEGANSVAKVIEASSTLKTLDLSWNDIGDEGAKQIAAALLKNTSLRSISLRANSISDVGAEAIAKSLHGRKFRYLDFEGNNMTEAGHAHITDAASEVMDLRLGTPVPATLLSSTSTFDPFAPPVLGMEIHCPSCESVTMHNPLDPSGQIAGRKRFFVCSKCLSWAEDPEGERSSAPIVAPGALDLLLEMDDDESVSSGEFFDPLAPEERNKGRKKKGKNNNSNNNNNGGDLFSGVTVAFASAALAVTGGGEVGGIGQEQNGEEGNNSNHAATNGDINNNNNDKNNKASSSSRRRRKAEEEEKVWSSSDEEPKRGFLESLLVSSDEEDNNEDNVVAELPRTDGELPLKDQDADLTKEEVMMMQNALQHREMQRKARLHRRRKGVCSWCYVKGEHMRVEKGGMFSRDRFVCDSCQQSTLPCRFCDEGMAKGYQDSLFPDEQLCSRCKEFRS